MLIGIAKQRKPLKGEDAPSQHQQGLVEAAREANLRGEPLLANLRGKRSPNLEAEVLVEPERAPQA